MGDFDSVRQPSDGASVATADAVAKAQAVLSEPELLRAMFDVGYFPPNTPPRTRAAAGFRQGT
jgi:hypothetical protein